MDPNETWKNLLLALAEGRADDAEVYARFIAWDTADTGDAPAGLLAALKALEETER